jgi:hypothetical protein
MCRAFNSVREPREPSSRLAIEGHAKSGSFGRYQKRIPGRSSAASIGFRPR